MRSHCVEFSRCRHPALRDTGNADKKMPSHRPGNGNGIPLAKSRLDCAFSQVFDINKNKEN